MKTKRKLVFTALLLLLLGNVVIFACSWIDKALSPEPPPDPLPITMGLKNDICNKLDPSHLDKVCQDQKQILANDIFPLFLNKLQPGITTYDEIYKLFDPSHIDVTNPFAQVESLDRAEFDLTGTGVSPIFFYRSFNEDVIRSLVFIRPNASSQISTETAFDLCKRLSLIDSHPLCQGESVVYAQDFYPIIANRFSIAKTNLSDARTILSPYSFIEKPTYYKMYFQFGDNTGSRILFYFDKNKILDNFVFLQNYGPMQIDPTTRNELCHNLNIIEDKKLCGADIEVYPQDYVKTIRSAFPIGIATYEDVQAKLGKYQHRFDPPVRDAQGKATTLSWYDLTGNHSTSIRFDFDADFVVTAIQIFIGES